MPTAGVANGSNSLPVNPALHSDYSWSDAGISAGLTQADAIAPTWLNNRHVLIITRPSRLSKRLELQLLP